MAENIANDSRKQKETLDSMMLKVSIILVFGSLAPLLDSTMVNVAIKTIAGEFNSTVSVIQWVITGYVLAMAIAVLVSGWAINRFGVKRLYEFSLILFFVGSVLSSMSWNIGTLIGFRLLQGIGAGLLMPTMTNMLVQISGGKNIGHMASIVSLPMLLAPILGPVLGGVIVNSLGWRWIFYVNIPVTIIALLLAFWGIPEGSPAEEKQPLSAALLIRGAGLGGVFIPLMVSAYVGLNSEQIPHASIATRILQTIGGAFGSAVLATIVEHQLASHSVSEIQNVVSAYNVAFWWSVGFTILSVIPTLFLTVYKKSEPVSFKNLQADGK